MIYFFLCNKITIDYLIDYTLQAYIRHPELASAKANRDFVIKSVCDAVEMINTANKGVGTGAPNFYEKPGELSRAMDDFDVR